ncbi:aspartate dehydrogenase [bacterium]|nr:aspartate dehydrogenase [bacterium]
MKRLKVGVVGCGTIGSLICEAIIKEISQMELVAVSDVKEGAAKDLALSLPKKVEVLSLEELVKKSSLIVEAASGKAAPTIVREAAELGRDVLVMSTGGLLANLDLFDLAREKGSRIYLPSGAIAGLDGLAAAKIGDIRSVTLTTRKPPKGLAGAPFIIERKIDLEAITEATTIFEGNALEAAKGFPANINVAATLSLAGIGPEKTQVRIIADPGSKTNTHEIMAEGDFGRMSTRCENLPSPFNPKTSYLAALSAIATLKGIVDPVKVGT